MSCIICQQNKHTVKSCIQCSAHVHAKCWSDYLTSKGDKYTEIIATDENTFISVYTTLSYVSCPQCRVSTPTEICVRKTRQSTVEDRKYAFLLFLNDNVHKFATMDDNGVELEKIYKVIKQNKNLKNIDDMKSVFDVIKINLRYLYDTYKWDKTKMYYFEIFGTHIMV